MAQLVSSRLVIHGYGTSATARFVSPVTARHASARRLSPASVAGAGGRRRNGSTLSPAFLTASYRSSTSSSRGFADTVVPGGIASAARARCLSHTHAHPSGAASASASASASSGSATAQITPSSSSSFPVTAAAAPKPAERDVLPTASYAPASNDPSLIETDPSELNPSSTASASASFRPLPTHTSSSLLRTYQQLGKSRLTFLVVLSAMAPYALCPASLSTGVGNGVGTLLALSAGTALCSASANAFNQLLEAPYDAQMARTRGRPLPRRALSPLHAFSFAVLCGGAGTSLLLLAVNPLTAALGLANVVLYAGVYTPLKRLSMVNTWIGAAVGAIPPLMGWTACTNSLLTFPQDAPGWILAGLLFAWQFPHFNSLAQSLRAEYARGGYRMMSVLDPGLNRRVSLRYALVLLPLCSIALPLAGTGAVDLASLFGLGGSGADVATTAATTASTQGGAAVVAPLPYALLSTPINAVMIHAAYKFWRTGTDKAARWCFWVSLVHLPAVMLLAMACKRDLWNGVGEAIGMGTTSVPPPAGAGDGPAAGQGSVSGLVSESVSQAKATAAAMFRTTARTDEGEREREKASLLRLDRDAFMEAKEQSRPSTSSAPSGA
ncbi:hypothetical protein A4X06_0g4121 [Tilletia controversa]|uniref:Protoheme IX farnesyltransferase, mitochondrial n=1 Tax=Tilletia controversa TaxID=13291 RepID=A0A8X7MSU9_9BASI|nr:hypothetical protein A4X06_0g4121 [Tilletia controversa]